QDPNKYKGSLSAYLAEYLSYPPPPPALALPSNIRTAQVAVCSASFKKLPNRIPDAPALKLPVSYFSQSTIYNDPPANTDAIDYPFGRPNTPYAAPKKISSIRNPADQWAMTDCDKQLLDYLGITAATYYDY